MQALAVMVNALAPVRVIVKGPVGAPPLRSVNTCVEVVPASMVA